MKVIVLQKMQYRNFMTNKQLQKPDLSIRELTKILFNTLRDENKLAIKMIVREYQEKQLNQREL